MTNSGPTPPAGNPWPALRRMTTHPAPGQQRLTFQFELARVIANHIADALGRLTTMQAVTEDIPILDPIAGTISSGPLFERLGSQAGRLNDVLGQHIGILREMRATFIVLGKAYAGTEHVARDSFEAIPIGGTPLPSVTVPPVRLPDIGINGKFPPPNAALTKQPNNSANNGWWTDKRDHPFDKDWKWLFQLGKNIRESPDISLATYGATKWRELAKQLVTVYAELSGSLHSVSSPERWSGYGRDAVIGAVDAYINKAVPGLHDGMVRMSYNLEFVGGWLRSTELSMPPKEENPAGETEYGDKGGYAGTTDDETYRYQLNMESSFVKGVTETYRYIPHLPEPAASFGGPQSQVPPGVNGAPPATVPAAAPPDHRPGPPPGDQSGPPPGSRHAPPQGGGGPGPGPGGRQRFRPGATPTPRQRTRPGQGLTPDQRRRQDKLLKDAERRSKEADRFNREQRERARKQQEDSAKFQKEMHDAARKQQAQSAAAQAAQQGQQAMQQAMQAAEQAAQRAAGNQARAGMPGISGTPGLDPKAGLPKVGGPGPGVGVPGSVSGRDAAAQAKLFPRASLSGAAPAAALGRAGMAPMAATPGSPGATGAAGRGAGTDANNRKRPTFLDSTAPIEEAVGTAPRVVEPVIER
ncbi:hypothetical protein [Nocardia sp. NPDC052566]|uniref:hypothetical protein n=1 Tax=Nocardia sp. NPDC052566 TaxID=3364330 RepID=UPI0037CA6837